MSRPDTRDITSYLLDLHTRSNELGYRELQRFAMERLQQMLPFDIAAGGFALKAWGSSARFDRVAVWRSGTNFDYVLVADRWVDRPSIAGRTPCDGSVRMPKGTDAGTPCSPIWSRRRCRSL